MCSSDKQERNFFLNSKNFIHKSDISKNDSSSITSNEKATTISIEENDNYRLMN